MALFASTEDSKYGLERRKEKDDEVDPMDVLNLSFRKLRYLPSENLYEQVLISNTVKSVQNWIRRNFRSYFMCCH